MSVNTKDAEAVRALADWDPIEVGPNVAMSEYSFYLPIVKRIALLQSYDDLRDTFVRILTDEMGLDYDPKSMEQRSSVDEVTMRILTIYKEN